MQKSPQKQAIRWSRTPTSFIMNKVKPEASYFFEADGNRVMAFIVNIDSVEMIPAIAEPLFQEIGAGQRRIHPVMSFDDLKKAVPHIIT